MNAIQEMINNLQQYKVKEIEANINIVKEKDTPYYEFMDKLLLACLQDERKSVQNIAKSYMKLREKQLLEQKRTEVLYKWEMELWTSGCITIVGIDEVGRGCVAGPVVAGAVILPIEPKILHLNDSKKLSPLQREHLDDQICSQAIDCAIGEVSSDIVDAIGIVPATFAAMKNAINNLTIKPEHILVDAFRIPEIKTKQTNIINGDRVSASIAAASIVAKVYRDRRMKELHNIYPQYGFDNNKGYGTQDHMDSIRKYGLSKLHRSSFLRNI